MEAKLKTQIYLMAKTMLFPLYLVYKVMFLERMLPYLKKVNDHCFQLFNFSSVQELILVQYLLKI